MNTLKSVLDVINQFKAEYQAGTTADDRDEVYQAAIQLIQLVFADHPLLLKIALIALAIVAKQAIPTATAGK